MFTKEYEKATAAQDLVITNLTNSLLEAIALDAPDSIPTIGKDFIVSNKDTVSNKASKDYHTATVKELTHKLWMPNGNKIVSLTYSANFNKRTQVQLDKAIKNMMYRNTRKLTDTCNFTVTIDISKKIPKVLETHIS